MNYRKRRYSKAEGGNVDAMTAYSDVSESGKIRRVVDSLSIANPFTGEPMTGYDYRRIIINPTTPDEVKRSNELARKMGFEGNQAGRVKMGNSILEGAMKNYYGSVKQYGINSPEVNRLRMLQETTEQDPLLPDIDVYGSDFIEGDPNRFRKRNYGGTIPGGVSIDAQGRVYLGNKLTINQLSPAAMKQMANPPKRPTAPIYGDNRRFVKKANLGTFINKAGDFLGGEGAPIVGTALSLLNTGLNLRNINKTPVTYNPRMVTRHATPFKSQLDQTTRTLQGDFNTANQAAGTTGVSNALSRSVNFADLTRGVNQATGQDVAARTQYNLAQDQMTAQDAQLNAQMSNQAAQVNLSNQISRRIGIGQAQQAGYQDLIKLNELGQAKDFEQKELALSLFGSEDGGEAAVRTMKPMLAAELGIPESEVTLQHIMAWLGRRKMPRTAMGQNTTQGQVSPTIPTNVTPGGQPPRGIPG